MTAFDLAATRDGKTVRFRKGLTDFDDAVSELQTFQGANPSARWCIIRRVTTVSESLVPAADLAGPAPGTTPPVGLVRPPAELGNSLLPNSVDQVQP